MISICKCCTKKFNSRSKKDYCSKKCERIDNEDGLNEDSGSLCWHCDRSGLDCCWLYEFKPVEGWSADKIIVDGFSTYVVKECPLFKERKGVE